MIAIIFYFLEMQQSFKEDNVALGIDTVIQILILTSLKFRAQLLQRERIKINTKDGLPFWNQLQNWGLIENKNNKWLKQTRRKGIGSQRGW